MGGVIDMRRFRGLKDRLPWTCRCFAVGGLALAGIVPFAGFWSKDEIISGTILNNFPIAGGLLWVGSFLTAFYMFRLVFLVFFNRRRWDPAVVHPHESPAVMTVPLLILAGAATVVGFLGFPPEAGLFHQYLAPVFSGAMHEAGSGYAPAHIGQTLTLQFISVLFAVAGIGLAFMLYWRPSSAAETISGWIPSLYRALRMRWYFDELYDLVFVRGGKALANGLWAFDRNVVDGAVNGVAGLFRWGGARLRQTQTGFVANYAFAIVLGVFVLLGYVLVSTLVAK
jgi:NADH-quinone oxidoreductase subunit L